MNFEQSSAPKIETNKEDAGRYPKNFPMYKDCGYEPISSVFEENGKNLFFNKNGDLNENMAIKIWYGVADAAHMNRYTVPKEDPRTIEISGISNIKSIPFSKCFDKSSAYSTIVSLSEIDPERQKVLDFQADIVLRSFTKNVKEKIEKMPGLLTLVERFIKTKIQYEADLSRNRTLSQKSYPSGTDYHGSEGDKQLSQKLKEEYETVYKELDKAMEDNKSLLF